MKAGVRFCDTIILFYFHDVSFMKKPSIADRRITILSTRTGIPRIFTRRFLNEQTALDDRAEDVAIVSVRFAC